VTLCRSRSLYIIYLQGKDFESDARGLPPSPASVLLRVGTEWLTGRDALTGKTVRSIEPVSL
jgi:hypothetical protein